eukprot:1157119-Pelagomonas_calceolata.AAC.12
MHVCALVLRLSTCACARPAAIPPPVARAHARGRVQGPALQCLQICLFHRLWRARVPVIVREARGRISWTPAVMRRVTKQYREDRDNDAKKKAQDAAQKRGGGSGEERGEDMEEDNGGEAGQEEAKLRKVRALFLQGLQGFALRAHALLYLIAGVCTFPARSRKGKVHAGTE